MRKTMCFLLFLQILSFAVMAATEESQKISLDDIITFGNYEQDNNLDNGPEPIEWIVLDVQNGKVLLLSKYGLEARPYNTELIDVTWETSTLRAWLNREFINLAFSAEEQSAILLTEVDNSSSQGYSEWNPSGGNNTQDKVFLLSITEASRYLGVQYSYIEGAGQNIKSRVAPTAYAIQTGASKGKDSRKTADGMPAVMWWLRSPSRYQSGAAIVFAEGSFDGSAGTNDLVVVRPAIWLNLESGIF